mgnify:CR=1 FL=1
MDMEELGYFIFMEEQEKKENEEREALMPPGSLLYCYFSLLVEFALGYQ